jgi:pimeloyl-[acyl-carrier protein] synthase
MPDNEPPADKPQEVLAMREPYVFSMHESPFSTDVPPEELRRRIAEAGADVITDEMGAVVMYLSEDDVDGVLNDPRFAAVALPTLHLSGVSDGPLWELWTHLMNAKDADHHRRIRNVVLREFSPKRVERFDGPLRDVAERLADGITPGQPFELWTMFAKPYAARVAATLVGIPDDDADRAAIWAFDLARAFFPFMSPELVARAERSAIEIQCYMDDLLVQRRADPKDDLISMLVSDEVAQALSQDEIRVLACNMIFAGLEATTKGVTTGTYHMLIHGQLARLATEPELVPSAVLETLRFSPPAQHVARLAAEDMVCQNVQLRAGQVASASIVAACRDPRRYANPHELDISRPAGKQLYFGSGPHYCLGASLAKLGLGIAFETLARRFPNLSLVGTDGNAEWDYEGFAGVVHLDCIA